MKKKMYSGLNKKSKKKERIAIFPIFPAGDGDGEDGRDLNLAKLCVVVSVLPSTCEPFAFGPLSKNLVAKVSRGATDCWPNMKKICRWHVTL